MNKTKNCIFYICSGRKKIAINNLKYLKKCYGYHNFIKIVILQSNSKDYFNRIKKVDSNIKIIKKKYKNNFTIQAKINNNILSGFKNSFKYNINFAICMEEDLKPSYDFLHFHQKLQKKYRNDKHFGAINSFSKEYNSKSSNFSYGKFYYGVGKGWSINRKIWLQVNKEIIKCCYATCKRYFDIQIEYFFRKKFFVIMPYRSRILEIPSNGININKKYFTSKEYIKEKKSYIGNNRFKIQEYIFKKNLKFFYKNDCLEMTRLNYFKSMIIFILRKIYFKVMSLI